MLVMEGGAQRTVSASLQHDELRVQNTSAKELGFDIDNLSESQRERIYQYYLPIFYWLLLKVEEKEANYAQLGISAPQGCGKTTVVEQLQKLLKRAGKRCASVSIDDFYLTNADQRALANANPDNRLLQCRGNAGTHDLDLGSQTLAGLVNLGEGASVAVPRYDKSAFAGTGDRGDPSTWPSVQGPLQVVLFEGWMLGFAPRGSEAAAAVDPALSVVDAALGAYRGAWDSFVDAWLVIKVADPLWVSEWRLQAEEAMRRAGKPGMTNEQLAEFVSCYLPAYAAYLPGLYKNGPTTARDGGLLTVEVNQGRSPVGAWAR